MGKRKLGDRTIPVPPNPKAADHHWLEKLDYDGHSFGLIVLQWNPIAQKWSHSGDVATGLYVNTEGWRYDSPCPLPPFKGE